MSAKKDYSLFPPEVRFPPGIDNHVGTCDYCNRHRPTAHVRITDESPETWFLCVPCIRANHTDGEVEAVYNERERAREEARRAHEATLLHAAPPPLHPNWLGWLSAVGAEPYRKRLAAMLPPDAPFEALLNWISPGHGYAYMYWVTLELHVRDSCFPFIPGAPEDARPDREAKKLQDFLHARGIESQIVGSMLGVTLLVETRSAFRVLRPTQAEKEAS